MTPLISPTSKLALSFILLNVTVGISMSNKNLTAKQSLFVKEYLIDLNATQAAIRAGYAERSAQQIGAENMLKPVVANAIQEAMYERRERLEMTQDDVLNKLEELRVKAIEINQLSVAAKCLELIGKHLRMFVDDSKQGAVVQVVVNRG